MSTPTLASAALGLQERLRSLAQRPAALTVKEIIDRRMAVYAGRDSALAYRLLAWQQILGDLTLEQLDPDVMREAREELVRLPALAYKGRDHEGREIFRPKARQGTKGPATANRYMAAISGAFTWAIEQRLTPRGWVNPCRGVRRLTEPPGRVKFLDPEERSRLLAACKASKYPRLYALVLMALTSGARQGELLGLKWGHIDFEAGLAYLERTKNGDRRTLVILPQVEEALRPFVGEPQRYVFGAARTRNKTPASIDTAWRKAVERAKLADFRFHDLRHDCASRLVQGGVDLSVVADVLGHKKLDMSRRYAHLKTETKARAMLAVLGTIGD